jgi:hypothetical protein
MLGSSHRRTTPHWTPEEAARMQREMERFAAKERHEHIHGVNVRGME